MYDKPLKAHSHTCHPGRKAIVVPPEAIHSVAGAYLAFARAHPALYEAMFTMPTGLHFADEETRPKLRDAFAALAAVVAPSKSGDETATITETFWATLHGYPCPFWSACRLSQFTIDFKKRRPRLAVRS